MAPKMLPEASRPPQDGSDGPKSFPRRPPGGQTPSNIEGTPRMCAVSLFRFRWPVEASRWPKRAPRGPQKSPKTAP
eukprot:5032710-Pyramimonas_sp.AAC.1